MSELIDFKKQREAPTNNLIETNLKKTRNV